MSDPRLVPSSWILIIDPNIADHFIADDMFGRIGAGSFGEADLEVRFLWRNLEVRRGEAWTGSCSEANLEGAPVSSCIRLCFLF